ncbi:MAG: hypothetical protein ABI742_04915 [Gemmatimonadota bacterium]
MLADVRVPLTGHTFRLTARGWRLNAESLIGLGLLAGVPAALAAAQLLRGQLFGVGTTDPMTIVLTIALLVAVAALAGYIPARRAAGVAPMVALRRE